MVVSSGLFNARPILTPTAKYMVRTIAPKYVAVNGSRGPEMRCIAYW